ncbi:hypothetical protein ZWY2020_034446 [Hordeum vulgare]|nr:hypothetical protein ZWY2020_034446 [Hordeum vulgare]
MPPSPPLPPPPPLPPVTSHLSRLSSSPPPRRTLRKPPRRRTPPVGGAYSASELPTIVLALACTAPTRRARGGHSVEQLVPARGSPNTLPACDTASGEGLAGVPLELLPPKKRLVRCHQYEAPSAIQEIAGHGHGDGFKDRPVSPTVEGDGDGDGFGNRPVSPAVEGDWFGNRSVSPTVDGDGEGFGNRPVSLTEEGEWDGHGDGEVFGNRSVPLGVDRDGVGDAGIRGEEPQVYRDDDGLRAELHRLHVSRPSLVLTKRLTLSDRSRDKARLVLPDGLVRASPLLSTMTPGERHLVLAGGGLAVPALDRLGRQYRMMLKRDRLARTYRLTGEWSLFLSRHGGMRDGDAVEVLAFRPPGWQARLGRCGEGGLGMALLHCRRPRAAPAPSNAADWNGWECNAADGLMLPGEDPARAERLPRRRRRRGRPVNHNGPFRPS